MEKAACRINGEFKEYFIVIGSGKNPCLYFWLATKEIHSWVELINGQSLVAPIIGKQKGTSFRFEFE